MLMTPATQRRGAGSLPASLGCACQQGHFPAILMTMQTGDRVRVYPHGSPDKGADGVVSMVASDELIAITFTFEDRPPFAIIKEGMFVSPNGVVMLAIRHTLDGKPWGPWVEVTGGGHYEVEPARRC